MTETAIHPRLNVPGAASGQYLGATTQLSFGDPGQELAALYSGCGIFDLGWRAQIIVAGKDRVRWLHNMVTNSVRDLTVNRGNYNFVLNAQGRILGDLTIFNRGEYLVLETDHNQVETLLTTLKRFIIMDKVELNVPEEARTAIGVCGPKSAAILAACGLDVAGMEPLEVRDAPADMAVTMVRGPEQKPDWYELWLDPKQAQLIWDRLTGAGARPAGAEALELWRVLHGIPQYGQDIRDRDLPQETGQAQALHFSKGCYIGQEIVERIRSRGQVHRKFTGFEFDRMPATGKYEVEGRTLAEITTAVRVSTAGGEKLIGLGYVRHEAAPAGAELDLGGNTAQVVQLPFEFKMN
jgi:folate-binding protein YgfZ